MPTRCEGNNDGMSTHLRRCVYCFSVLHYLRSPLSVEVFFAANSPPTL